MSKKGAKPRSSKDPDGSKMVEPDFHQGPVTCQYPNDDKPKQTLDLLDRNRATGEFCDVQLKLSPSHTIHAHKAILCACSPYFEGMFMSTFMEATSDFVDMSHTTENSDVLEHVIDSFYGHKFEINADNAAEVLNLATMLLIDDLRDVCGKVMKNTINVQNAAQTLQLAINYQLEDLKELVRPILYCRFHDYIMFQEDIVEMECECFAYLLNLVNTKNVSRKADYIRLILRWFNRSAGDERANVAINALQYNMNFEVTKNTYKDAEKDILDVIESLNEANSDVSPEIRDKFLLVLQALKPADFRPDETCDSDIEEIPVPEVDLNSNIGPHTKEQGYTEKEEAKWKEHREVVKEFNELDKKWDDCLEKRKRDNPNYSIFDDHPEMNSLRNKLSELKRQHDKTFGEFPKRNLKVKTPEELEEESRLLEMVVVLVPSLELMETKDLKPEDAVVNDEIIICAYVDRKKAWYRLGSIKAGDVKNSTKTLATDGPGSHPDMGRRPDSGSGSGSRWRPDPEELEEMMFMAGPDMPEMMRMMEDMPGPYRRQMEHMARRRMPPHHMMRMMMHMDEDGMRHPRMRMMMREYGMMGQDRGMISRSDVKSLLQGKWKMVYLKQKLYFCHSKVCRTIWCYDIVAQTWEDYTFCPEGKKHEMGHVDADDGIDMIVMGQTLYVVVLIAMLDTRNDFFSNRDRSESRERDVKTRFMIMKLTERNEIEPYYETNQHDCYVDKGEFEAEKEDKERNRYSYESATPMKQGVLKFVLHKTNEETLNIFAMQRTTFREKSTFNISYMLTVWLDLKEEESEIGLPHHHNFVREMTPLENDDLLGIVNDGLRVGSIVDLGRPHTPNRCSSLEHCDVDSSYYLEAEQQYPVCKSQITSDGRTLWILEGDERDVSEMRRASPQMRQGFISKYLKKESCIPPPFTRFSLACTGRIDRGFLRRFNPPTKYLHA